MIETFERLIGLLNDNLNLVIIKTYQNLLWGEYIYINFKIKSYKIACYVCYMFHNLEIKNIQKNFEACVNLHYYHRVK